MQAHGRHQQGLIERGVRRRPGAQDVNPGSLEPGLPVNLMAGQRAVAAADAQVHVHQQQVVGICQPTVEDTFLSRLDGRVEDQGLRRLEGCADVSGSPQRCPQRLQQGRVAVESFNRDFQQFGPAHRHGPVGKPRLTDGQSIETKDVARPQVIRDFAVLCLSNAFDPAIPDEQQLADDFACTGQDMAPGNQLKIRNFGDFFSAVRRESEADWQRLRVRCCDR